MSGRLLTPEEVATHLGVPLQTLYRWRYQGEGPTALRVGRHLRYRAEDLAAYEHKQAAESTRRLEARAAKARPAASKRPGAGPSNNLEPRRGPTSPMR